MTDPLCLPFDVPSHKQQILDELVRFGEAIEMPYNIANKLVVERHWPDDRSRKAHVPVSSYRSVGGLTKRQVRRLIGKGYDPRSITVTVSPDMLRVVRSIKLLT
ncbi:hypothetical protein [Methylobacterium oryzisoli]|uniref:hypothetical protein n=1 Tax=Methylobacterium oryzisoli TaxID=3385502 RepID=UPI003891E2AB